MLAEERFSLIMEQLDRKRTVTVQELCEALNTSESTIRRDLTELDRQGKLNKVHGGATLPDSREQFEMRTHKRLIDVIRPTAKTTDALQKLEIPAGVDIVMELK